MLFQRAGYRSIGAAGPRGGSCAQCTGRISVIAAGSTLGFNEPTTLASVSNNLLLDAGVLLWIGDAPLRLPAVAGITEGKGTSHGQHSWNVVNRLIAGIRRFGGCSGHDLRTVLSLSIPALSIPAAALSTTINTNSSHSITPTSTSNNRHVQPQYYQYQ